MRPTPRSRPPSRLTWSLEIDVAHLPEERLVRELCELLGPLGERLRHDPRHVVELRVGSRPPSEFADLRVREFLREAHEAGVPLHIVGAPPAVRDWWDLLTEPVPVVRHLKVVR